MIRSRVEELKGVLERGEYIYNGEPIIFSTRPHIMSGQHILEACAQSGVPIVKDVKAGIPPSAEDAIDNISHRTNAQRLRGEINTNRLAATLSWIWRWENGNMQSVRTPSPQQQRDVLRRHTGCRESVSVVHRARELGYHSVLAFVHYAAGLQDEGLRDAFFEKLFTGLGLEEGDPESLLRARMLDNRVSKAKLKAEEVLALCLKAWMHRRANKKLHTLRWRRDGKNGGEPFPTI